MKQRIRLRGVSREVDGRAWEGFDMLRIGRQQHWEIELRDTSISRCHAELTHVDEQGWVVRDLGSTNGTYLNGVRVGSGECLVHERDLLQLGNLVLRVVSIDQVDVPTLENYCETVQVEATTQHSYAEAFEVVARHLASHPQTGSQLLGLLWAGHDLHHNNSIDELLRKSVDEAARTLNARRGALVLVEEGTGQLVLQVATPKGTDKKDSRRFSQTLAQRCLARGESLLSHDTSQDFDVSSADSIVRGNMRSVLCALVRSPRRRLGVLHFDRGPGDRPFTIADLHLADAIAASLAGSIESAQFIQGQQRSWFIRTVITLAQTIELRDPYTFGHAQRVTDYALLLADALNLSGRARQEIDTGSRLHDIGKIGISDSVLLKPGRLSDVEFEHMKSHTVKGAAILSTIPDLVPVLPVVRNHHERWDGRGYPDGLAGEKIPLAARIVAVADAFDAMTSDRPYRPCMSLDEAFNQVQQGAGTQFDPECSRVFLNLKHQLAGIARHQKPCAEPPFGALPLDVANFREAACVLV